MGSINYADFAAMAANEVNNLDQEDLSNLQAEQSAWQNSQETKPKNNFSMDWIGDLAGAVEGVAGQFNTGYQNSQVQIAQANAETAKAMASATPKEQKPNYILYAGVALVIVIIAVIMFKNKSK